MVILDNFPLKYNSLVAVAAVGVGEISKLMSFLPAIEPRPDQVHAASQRLFIPLIDPCSTDTDVKPANELFRFRFGASGQVLDARHFDVPVATLSEVTIEEIWLTSSPVSREIDNGVKAACSSDFAFFTIETEFVTPRQTARQAYIRLLTLLRQSRYLHLVRAWNYFPDINRGSGDQEFYRQFSAGRAEAFRSCGFSSDSFPAGTAIGSSSGNGFRLAVLACRHPARMVENPRQISAYNYPRRFGPVGPSFARATLLETPQSRQIFVSGTASILGANSCYPGNLSAQLDVTLDNIITLIGKEIVGSQSRVSSPVLRIYLRHMVDTKPLFDRICARLGSGAQMIFLHGDICRSELLVEIEGVFWL